MKLKDWLFDVRERMFVRRLKVRRTVLNILCNLMGGTVIVVSHPKTSEGRFVRARANSAGELVPVSRRYAEWIR